MLDTRLMFSFVAALIIGLGSHRCAIAREGSANRQQQLEGSEYEGLDALQFSVLKSRLRLKMLADAQFNNAYNDARQLRNTGITFAVIGGLMLIAGAAIPGAIASEECYSEDGSCGLRSLISLLTGTQISAAGGLFFLTPGVIMTVTGYKQMKNLVKPREIKNYDAAFRGYRRLRKSGIVLSIIGGTIHIAGATGVGYAIKIGNEPILTTALAFGGGLFLLTPGIIMAIVGDRKMIEVSRKRSTHAIRASFRPTFKGVSFITSASGNMMSGLALNFTF